MDQKIATKMERGTTIHDKIRNDVDDKQCEICQYWRNMIMQNSEVVTQRKIIIGISNYLYNDYNAA